jgi:hypothetical protein
VSRRSNSAADETIGQAGLCEIADRSRELLSTAHSINAAEDNKIPRLIARAALFRFRPSSMGGAIAHADH